MNKTPAFITLFFAMALIVACSSSTNTDTIVGYPRSIDGDTLLLDGKTIRLHGIDAPELRQPCRTENGDIDCGTHASRSLLSHIGRSPVRCTVEDIDPYERVIATCYMNDNENINQWLVQNGHALAYTQHSNKYIKDEEFAKDNDKGIHRWTFTKPWDYRKANK